MVQVRISAAGPFQFNYLTIDTCTSSVWNVETSSSTFVTCPSLMASNAQLFNDVWWASQPTTQIFPGFACTQTLSGATAVIILCFNIEIFSEFTKYYFLKNTDKNLFQFGGRCSCTCLSRLDHYEFDWSLWIKQLFYDFSIPKWQMFMWQLCYKHR